MTHRTEILARFSGDAGVAPLYLPDLTLWYSWHRGRGTLPIEWEGLSLSQIACAMGVPLWLPVRPWRVETPSIQVETTEGPDARATTWPAPRAYSGAGPSRRPLRARLPRR